MEDWEYGERYNVYGEWNPRLVYSEVKGEYVEPDQLECEGCNAEPYEPCREGCLSTVV
jgi:hypothetical protein